MVRVNPDPHKTGYKYSPTNRVTAAFESVDELSGVLDSLQLAGFKDDTIEVFAGETGADQVDFKGKHHGVVVRFLRDLVLLLSDEQRILDRLDKVMREGGLVISVDTKGDESKKETAMSILKAARGRDVAFWGPLAVEQR